MLLIPALLVEMEGQPDTELKKHTDQKDCEKEPAGMRSDDEWRGWQKGQAKRNTLYLVSAATQWILLLACLIYLGTDSLQLWTVRAHVQPIVCWPVELSMGFCKQRQRFIPILAVRF